MGPRSRPNYLQKEPAPRDAGSDNGQTTKDRSPRRYRDEPIGGLLFQWEWWLGYLILVLLGVHLPWNALATMANFDAFVSFVAIFVPTVGLESEGMGLRPLEATQLQLAFVHSVCIVAVTTKLIRQRPAHHYHPHVTRLPWYRPVIGLLLLSISLAIVVLTLQTGDLRDDILGIPEGYYYAHQYQLVFINSCFAWFPILVILSFMKYVVQELRRRSRIPIPWEQNQK